MCSRCSGVTRVSGRAGWRRGPRHGARPAARTSIAVLTSEMQRCSTYTRAVRSLRRAHSRLYIYYIYITPIERDTAVDNDGRPSSRRRGTGTKTKGGTVGKTRAMDPASQFSSWLTVFSTSACARRVLRYRPHFERLNGKHQSFLREWWQKLRTHRTRGGGESHSPAPHARLYGASPSGKRAVVRNGAAPSYRCLRELEAAALLLLNKAAHIFSRPCRGCMAALKAFTPASLRTCLPKRTAQSLVQYDAPVAHASTCARDSPGMQPGPRKYSHRDAIVSTEPLWEVHTM
jgi:hypothetical protein